MLGGERVGRHVPTEVLLQTAGVAVGGANRWVLDGADRLVGRGRRSPNEALRVSRDHDYGLEIDRTDGPHRDAERARYERSRRAVADRYRTSV